MIERINELRAGNNLLPLRLNAQLALAATRHAADLARNPRLFDGDSHTGSDGSTIGQRIGEAGYAADRFGEVTGWYTGAWVEYAAAWMVEWWMRSDAHRPTLLTEEMTEVGLGYVYQGTGGLQHVWVVNFGRRVGAPTPEPPPPEPPGDYVVYAPVVAGGKVGAPSGAVDLLDYLRGDGRAYRVGNAWGGFEVFQTQAGGDRFYQVKAWDDLSRVNWEEYIVDGDFIRRDVDTSPGGDRFYRQFGAPWVRRWMRPGERFQQGKRLQFFNFICEEIDPHLSGHVIDTIEFVTRYERYTFRARDWPAITLEDVVELRWVEGGERYFCARGFGLVAWEREHQDPHSPAWTAISEMRPDVGRLTRLVIDCLG